MDLKSHIKQELEDTKLENKLNKKLNLGQKTKDYLMSHTKKIYYIKEILGIVLIVLFFALILKFVEA